MILLRATVISPYKSGFGTALFAVFLRNWAEAGFCIALVAEA